MDLLMSPACKLWDLIVMGGLEQTSSAKANFFFIIEVKAHWKSILTHCLKNWMQKDKDKWPFDYLLWKIRAHSLMKQSILHPGVWCTSMAIGIKWCPSWSPLYLWILTMTLSSIVTLASWLMTFEAIVSRVRLVTTTLATNTWSS
jgi:hypothetical protein